MSLADDHGVVQLLVRNARCVATVDATRREIANGWVAVNHGLIVGVGGAHDPAPLADRIIGAEGCLVTPGLVNTHHHIYQNLTRAYRPMTSAPLFGWLKSLYPLWSHIDEEAIYESAWVGLAELALGGCTTSSDHLYVHPVGGGDLLSAEIRAAGELGFRFHPTHGSMSVSEKDGGLPPDSVVRDDDEILAESERLVALHHDRSHGAMVRIALAPCSPFSVSPQLMRQTAELAERLDVRLHTHLAENAEDDAYSLATFGRRCIEQFEDVGWATSRSWVAHCVMPDPDEVKRLGAAHVGVAHCPSSNMILSSGLAPVVDLRAAGSPVGLGCDGSSSADSASLWQEARMAMLIGKLRSGADRMDARTSLEIATRGGAACLGRSGEIGEITVGAVGDLAIWDLTGPVFAGAVSDPVEAWLRCGPTAARQTIVAGRVLVDNGTLTDPSLEQHLRSHDQIARRIQKLHT